MHGIVLDDRGYNRTNEMNDALGNDSVLEGKTGPETTWVNEMTFVMNHAPGTGSIARPVGQQSSALPHCYGASLNTIEHIDACNLSRLCASHLENPE